MASKSKGRRPRIALVLLAAVLVLTALVVYMGYGVWLDSQEVFQDVTVELGQEALSLRDFMTDRAVDSRASFVSDPGAIDLSRVGTTQVTLRHGTKDYTVTLTVQDTTAPVAEVPEVWEIQVPASIPAAAELAGTIRDESAVEVSYAQEPQVPADYCDTQVELVLEDESGNSSRYQCTLRFTGWLRQEVAVELGQELTAQMLMTDPDRDAALVEQAWLDQVDVSQVGNYTLTADLGHSQEVCAVTVQDTTAPELEVHNVRIFPGGQVGVEDFVVSAEDISGEPEVTLAQELPDLTVSGQHTVTIQAQDAYGNLTQAEATLWISSNMNPPQIRGASEPLTIDKHDEDVDYLKGVTAKDDIDKTSTVTVDTSTLDVHTAGTYFITYSSVDSSGNEGTYRRKVVVEHDEEDTAALVAEIAETLPDDPEAIRDYVHDTIDYSHDWGGDDPTWHGFTTYAGNCYVHAHCLQALLEHKGYETQLIWVTNKSHYWLIIKLEEGWRHIDSTPSPQHEKVGLGTDDVRYKNLNGRNWDRSKWPACE